MVSQKSRLLVEIEIVSPAVAGIGISYVQSRARLASENARSRSGCP
jgi:hypothetical protein